MPDQLQKSVMDSETIYTELMIPSYANFGGKIHGGILLSLMDKVAFICASKHSGQYCVTVAVEGVEFKQAVEVGELVTIKASIIYVGKTTMIVGMRVESFKPTDGIVRHTNSCYFTMAAKDSEGNLTTVPGIILENEVQLRRFCKGKIIRKLSLEKRELLKTAVKDQQFNELKGECQETDKCFLTN
ncbi:acyl-CoA thioesterase [Aquirufa nivalisilvae]